MSDPDVVPRTDYDRLARKLEAIQRSLTGLSGDIESLLAEVAEAPARQVVHFRSHRSRGTDI